MMLLLVRQKTLDVEGRSNNDRLRVHHRTEPYYVMSLTEGAGSFESFFDLVMAFLSYVICRKKLFLFKLRLMRVLSHIYRS